METQDGKQEKREEPFCLNRTMQYGNSFFQDWGCQRKIRLNRTMQYGNNNKKKQYKNTDFV